MNFGVRFIQYIKTLFKAPKAEILTNGVLSGAFSLSKGVRQGCCISPLLFSLAIEPLALAIRANTAISGVKFGTSEHKISLYADDVLIYMTDPADSVPPLYQCLQEYSAASGYKINLTKSEVLPLNTQDLDIRTITEPLKLCPGGFKYLGINIRKVYDKVLKDNYLSLLEKIQADTQRWIDLPLSLIGRVNIIKMNVLPKLIYLFQCIPLNVPKSFFKEINKATSSFLWQNKTPRVKLTTLQAPYTKGGLNLPNFRCYYLASQFRPIWTWLHAESSEVRWLSIEQYELKATPLQIIPFLGTKKNLSSITKNPIILNTFGAWQESHTMLGIDISLLRKTPLWDSPNIPYPIADGTLKKWINSGITTVADLYSSNMLSNFQQLSSKFNLPIHNFFLNFFKSDTGSKIILEISHLSQINPLWRIIYSTH